MTKIVWTMFTVSLLCYAIPSRASQHDERPSFAMADELGSPDGKGDPAAKLYKEGYHLILDEQWDEAQKKLKEVVAKYPSSDYVDDAEYWIAYAKKHTDPEKARHEYEQFIKEYPDSKYVDDALADLSELDVATTITVTSAGGGDSAIVYKRLPGGYGYGIGTSMSLAKEQLKRSEHQLRRQLEHLGHPLAPVALPHLVTMPHVPRPDEEEMNEETKIKMKALYAIGETKEDEKSFSALRDVALDMKEERPLREAALDALSEFKKFEVVPVYIEIVKKDTSEDLQNYAIDYISQNGKDKGKTVQTLIDLYKVLPKEKIEQKRAIFYAIADVGSDKAVDFLASVARTSDNYDLRTEAIYYLGSIGGEKARTALYEIIRGKKEK